MGVSQFKLELIQSLQDMSTILFNVKVDLRLTRSFFDRKAIYIHIGVASIHNRFINVSLLIKKTRNVY